MNWSLIFTLSLLGFLMAIATVFLIPANIGPFLWAIIFLVSAIIIAKSAYNNFFLHGFFLGIANYLWMALIHFVLFTKYIYLHGHEAEMMTKLPRFASPRVMILIYVPLIGVASGIIIGLFSFLASKVFRSEV